MSMLRVLRTLLASLYLLVGMGLGMGAGPVHGLGAPMATMATASGCADHVGGTATMHHAAKPSCAPTTKLAEPHHCPNCPVGGSCTDVPTAATVTASGLVAARSASRPTLGATTDPTGRNPLPDPRPPRAAA